MGFFYASIIDLMLIGRDIGLSVEIELIPLAVIDTPTVC